jgi:hypothetical protein
MQMPTNKNEIKLSAEYLEFVQNLNNKPIAEENHAYYIDIENEAFAKWDRVEFPITTYHKTTLWFNHIKPYLDTAGYRFSHSIPYDIMYEIMEDLALERYKSWLKLDLSDEWFREENES